MASQTKVFSLRQLVPPELERDIIRSTNLDSYDKVKAYVIEQVAIRRDIKVTASDGPVPMEVDAIYKKVLASLEENPGPEHGHEDCSFEHHVRRNHRGHGDENGENQGQSMVNQILSMIKGGQKGKGKGKSRRFEGNCSHCSAYGHRMNQCWKKDQEMDQWRKGKTKANTKQKDMEGRAGRATKEKARAPMV